MKKLFFIAALALTLTSCDFMLKEREDTETEVKTEQKVVIGTDKDENGCVASAGYRWSILKNNCTRVFEEGYRLNTIEELKKEDASKSAFIIFEEDGDRAELFLPDEGSSSVMLKREKEGKPYTGSGWTLLQNKGYTLSRKGQILFAAAAIEENKIIGSDQPEEQ
jgi:hypothetical protein